MQRAEPLAAPGHLIQLRRADAGGVRRHGGEALKPRADGGDAGQVDVGQPGGGQVAAAKPGAQVRDRRIGDGGVVARHGRGVAGQA